LKFSGATLKALQNVSSAGFESTYDFKPLRELIGNRKTLALSKENLNAPRER
jgi:hypothetical protein